MCSTHWRKYIDFTPIDGNRMNGLCKLCKKNYKDLKGIYSNFLKHLQRKHLPEYSKIFPSDEKDSSEEIDVISLYPLLSWLLICIRHQQMSREYVSTNKTSYNGIIVDSLVSHDNNHHVLRKVIPLSFFSFLIVSCLLWTIIIIARRAKSIYEENRNSISTTCTMSQELQTCTQELHAW